MLLTDKLEIKVVYKNLEYFKNLGLNVRNGETININIKELSPDSHIRVKIKCDICGEEKEIAYREYLRQNKLHDFNFDTCRKCSQVKNKITSKEKYGVKNYSQTKEFIEKSRITKVEKYGNSNYNNIEKTKKTNLEKYKTEYSFLNPDVKKKIKTSNLEKYGVENVLQNKEIKNQIENTNIKKYGFKNPFQSDEIKRKIIKTNLSKYGVEYYSQSKEKIIKTLATNIKNGRWVKIEDRTDFYNYYLLVYSHTMKNKKELFDNWSGYDFYTNEYILENFNLDSNDKNYPTIDHKNSIRYGFDNNIPYNEISDIENLCITTRSTNSSKNKKIESEFKI